MIQGKTTFVSALRDFFGEPPITTDQLKNLSEEDRKELRQMLIDEGYDIAPVDTPPR